MLEGDRIVHVGPRSAAFGSGSTRPSTLGTGCSRPGLISTHAHIAGSPLDRSFIEDTGRPQFYYSGLFETLPVRDGAQDEAASRACVDFSMAELLRGGVTTVLEIGQLGEHVVERAAHFGLRVYFGLSFRSGRWLTKDGRRVHWEWDEERGRRASTRALALPRPRRRRARRPGPLLPRPGPGRHVHAGAPARGQAAPPTSAAARSRSTRPSRWSSSTRCWPGTGRRPWPGSRSWASSGRRTILGHAIIVGGSSWTQSPGRRRPDHGRGGLLGRPRGLGVRPPRRPDGVLRPLSGGRREHVARHGHQSAERDRGDALGGGALEDDGAQHAGDDGGPRLRRRHPRRRASARAATTWGASRRARRPISSCGRAGRGA